MNEVAEIVKRLRGWRVRNGYSQRVATEALGRHGLPVSITTLQQWESGRRRPGKLAGGLLEKFLVRWEGKPIKGVRIYRKKSRLSAGDVAEIRRLRSEGKTLVVIATRFGVDKSYVSRIVKKERLAGTVE
jgi:transcriptional regulator with XRE-family HTH domain